MKSRAVLLLALALGLLAAALAAEAQQAGKVWRIGILSPAPVGATADPPYDAFREALRDLGYIEGKNIVIEFRFAEGKYERLPELAADLVRLPVDVIVTDGGDVPARAAARATNTIPIVMGTAGDPVAAGLVTSLPRPGGNVTGFILSYVDLAAKRLQLLKELVPTAKRVAVLWDAAQGNLQFRAAAAVARSLGVQLQSLPVRVLADVEAAFEAARRQRAGALLQLSSRMLSDNRKVIVQRALQHRLPGMFELGFCEPQTGALACYGPRVSDNFRRAAVYVDKILKGAYPGELPVEQSSKFYLVINLKTAKVLGVTVPPSLLLRADEVIE